MTRKGGKDKAEVDYPRTHTILMRIEIKEMATYNT
jgi:hypothetical protein